MHAAQVTVWGQPPRYVETKCPPPPEGFVQVKVLAAGIHHVVRSRASGHHYSSGTLPLIPGTDGVGTTPDGQTVFFSVFTTGGSFAEYVNVSKRALFPLPDGLDPILAAALVNPALSSWMALTSRCNVKPGFSVCILGATSFSGRIAIQIARSLGASKIVGVARNAETLASLDLDQRAILDSDYVPDTDVILDYVYGPPTERILAAIKPDHPVQYVHIGSLAGLEINLPGSVLRSKDLTIRGSGTGAFSLQDARKELPQLLNALKNLKLDVILYKLQDIEYAWNDQNRVVVVP